MPAKRALTEPRRPKFPISRGTVFRGGSQAEISNLARHSFPGRVITRELHFSLADFFGGTPRHSQLHRAQLPYDTSIGCSANSSLHVVTARAQHLSGEGFSAHTPCHRPAARHHSRARNRQAAAGHPGTARVRPADRIRQGTPRIETIDRASELL